KNAAVVFTSQSLTDVERCPQRNIIIESCQTKIFLPNAEAETTQSKALYLDMGLNEKEIQLLRYAVPKKHYLYHSPLGGGLFDVAVGGAGVCFGRATGGEDPHRMGGWVQTCGDQWPAVGPRQRGGEVKSTWWARVYARRNEQEEKRYVSPFA